MTTKYIEEMEIKIEQYQKEISELENIIKYKKEYEKLWQPVDNSIFGILRRIKKLKPKELKLLSDKLEVIRKNKVNKYYIAYEKNPEDHSISYSDTHLLFDDLLDSLTYCIYHFSGKRYESQNDGESCPCNCLCQSCELIPEHKIGIRMQELGNKITEENVLLEMNGQKEINR